MLTTTDVAKIAETTVGPIVVGFVDTVNKFGAAYEVDTLLRLQHFIAQCAEESARFNTLTEFASGTEYEGRHDLGNTQPGDGKRFKGRGVIQLTGRANYIAAGLALGLDLVGNPDSVATPFLGTLVALWFWHVHGLAHLADRDDIVAMTKVINGGTNGLAQRQAFLASAKHVLTSAAVVLVPTQTPPPSISVRDKVPPPAPQRGDSRPTTVTPRTSFWALVLAWLKGLLT